MEQVNWQRTRDILISLICIGIILWATWGVMGQFGYAIILLLLAMAVAFLLSPIVNFLERFMPRVVGTLIVYILVLAALAAFGSALVFSLIQQVQRFSAEITNYASQLPTLSVQLQHYLINNGIPSSTVNAAITQIQNSAFDFAKSAGSNVLSLFLAVTNTILDTLLVLVISFYLTLDGRRIRDSIISIVPKSWLTHVLLFEDALNRVVGNYIRGQLTLALIVGVLAGGGSWLFLGLGDYALIIGVLAFLCETIPMVGPFLASIPAIILSLLLPNPFPHTIWVAVYFLAIQMVESNILGPRIVGHAVGLHPVASILALIVGVQIIGAFGALLATPILAAAWVVVASLYRSLVRGETADDILAKKRTPWVRRPTTALINRGRRMRLHHTPSGSLVPVPHMPVNETSATHHSYLTKVKSTSGPIEHIDLLYPVSNELDTPNGGEPTEHGNIENPPVKVNAMSAEHIDLLRPIPNMEEPHADNELNQE